MIPSRRRSSERGSAILVVLVFAAVIAIMLYRELPVATFEAQRQKEELLIDRGNEYKRAIQLYVRKIQSFPPSLDALENTNRMRFLRARYPDPFTGKADWRFLHAGPGGTITDSKIKKTGTGLPGAPGSTASTLGAPAAVTNPFANSFNGANPAGDPSAVSGNNFPQRPPAVSASASGGGAPSPNTDLFGNQTNGQPPDQQALAAALQTQNDPNQSTATTAPYPGYPGPPDPSNPLANGGSGSGTFPAGGAGRFRGGNPTGNSFPPSQFGQTNTQDPMQSALSNPNPPPAVNQPTTTTQSAFNNQPVTTASPGMGAMNQNNTVGGGIAGVASTSPGKTIKVLNDQTDRGLWEFVYDMQKEANANAPGIGNNANQQQNGTPTSGVNNTIGGSFGIGNPGQTNPMPTQPSTGQNQ